MVELYRCRYCSVQTTNPVALYDMSSCDASENAKHFFEQSVIVNDDNEKRTPINTPSNFNLTSPGLPNLYQCRFCLLKITEPQIEYTKYDICPKNNIGNHHWFEPLETRFENAASSKQLRYTLIPRPTLDAWVRRSELGLEKHKEKAYNALQNQEALVNEEWVLARAEHIIHHTLNWVEVYLGIKPYTDDDAGAILWGGGCLFEAMRVRLERINNAESNKKT